MKMLHLAAIATACALAFGTGASAQGLSKASQKPGGHASRVATPLRGSAKENVVDNATAAKAQAAVLASPSYRTARIKIEADKRRGITPPQDAASLSADAGPAVDHMPGRNR